MIGCAIRDVPDTPNALRPIVIQVSAVRYQTLA
jgi:hypothetical protein